MQLQQEFANLGLTPDQITLSHLTDFYARFALLSGNPRADITLPKIEKPSQAASKAPLVAVIVETRRHFNLVNIVRQVHTELQVPIQIFHGLGNLDFILKSPLQKLVENGDVLLTLIKTNQFDSASYNQTFLDAEFWNAVIGRKKILVFQTDAMLLSRSPHKIDSFLSFDYIGSGWPRERPTGIIADGGNGGLSLRDWGKTMACVKRFGNQNHAWGEDSFFAFHMELMGCKIGKTADCARFSSQMRFSQHSFGAHKLDLMSPLDRGKLLLAYPAAWRLLPRVRQLRRKWSRQNP